MSAKEHIILVPWSDCSSAKDTQPSGGISNHGVACGHCLECCNLYHFFSNWWQNSSVVCVGVAGSEEVGGDNFLKNTKNEKLSKNEF